jgi:hypothetical protein
MRCRQASATGARRAGTGGGLAKTEVLMGATFLAIIGTMLAKIMSLFRWG